VRFPQARSPECVPNQERLQPSLKISTQETTSAPELDSANDFVLWQLADSAFPTGGFAHSAGLEAAWHHGELRDETELESFLDASLLQFGHGSFPFMTAAYRQPARLNEFDRIFDTFSLNHVANRASRAQGRAYFTTTRRIFGLSELEIAHKEQPPFFHLAPVSGFITRSLEINLDSACGLFVFQHLRGLIASAVRLGVVGPLQGQAIQHRMQSRAKEVLLRCRDLSISRISQTSPLLDLWQARHDSLYSRLFQS
jgi:urease accessory protein